MRKILLGGALVALVWAPPAFSQSTQEFYGYFGGAASSGGAVPFIGSASDGAVFMGWTSGGGATATGASGSSEPAAGEPSGSSGPTQPQAASAGGEAPSDRALAQAAVKASGATSTP